MGKEDKVIIELLVRVSKTGYFQTGGKTVKSGQEEWPASLIEVGCKTCR